MILKEVFNKGIEILKEAKIDAPVVDAGVMLCHVLGCDKVFLYAHQDFVLSLHQINEFFRMVNMRAEGMPVQYITGHQEFMSLDFTVRPGVLIPRQDTEILVESVIDHARKLSADRLDILDIGTGSGCIAISLAHYLKNSFVTAVDISDTALDTARLNAEKNGVSQRFVPVKSDLFSELGNVRFDIVVSNPPYIPGNEIAGLQREVSLFEPELALAGGEDGLLFYKRIIGEVERYLVPNGLLAFEVGSGQSQQLEEMMGSRFHNVHSVKDLAGINRVVLGLLK